ncbi:hypothetical protein TNCV_5025981 [Trichonephila clavipes]|uniref:Type II toxin-antitoxin system RelE/ParE family toxin n=1 Tax=Trichonephila clavipes TaxID=2585209 RepID=A0A8X6V982_TRICX|nr:hypothetical protein TNCV_5025951 [Trichonephila clavipes]GFX99540.1 hypothetical protein TNCV_5025961 [Trichonephila clavipes]GFX99541.1 hypothetical protein TNCV_5025971 [Trichonephila clavipes]GFX99542.1 hypothetical protein TNCV_5025981 [Trichonephila clavipes]
MLNYPWKNVRYKTRGRNMNRPNKKYVVTTTNSFEKDMKTAPKCYQNRLEAFIPILEADPINASDKKLENLESQFMKRFGDWRFIYYIDIKNSTVCKLKFRHRKKVYK